jgi:ADP-ribose pyrophosphatase
MSREVAPRRLLHRGKKFDFEILTLRDARGNVIEREVVRHPGAVVIVPVLDRGPDGQAGPHIVLIRNRRIAVGQTLLECPAGTLEPPEPPERCAARELIEETGYRPATVTALGWFYTTPGLTDEKMHAFAATGLEQVGQDLEEDENITFEIVPAGRALGMIGTGELADAKSMLALILADRRGMLGVRSG